MHKCPALKINSKTVDEPTKCSVHKIIILQTVASLVLLCFAYCSPPDLFWSNWTAQYASIIGIIFIVIQIIILIKEHSVKPFLVSAAFMIYTIVLFAYDPFMYLAGWSNLEAILISFALVPLLLGINYYFRRELYFGLIGLLLYISAIFIIIGWNIRYGGGSGIGLQGKWIS